MAEHKILKMHGKMIEITASFSSKHSKWKCTAKIPDSSVIAYCHHSNRERAETVSMSRLLNVYDEFHVI